MAQDVSKATRAAMAPSLVAALAMLTACEPAAPAKEPAPASSASPPAAVMATPMTQDAVESGAGPFVAALRSQDSNHLRNYYPDATPQSDFADDATDVVFVRKVLQPIVKKPMGVKLLWQKGHVFSVLFYQRRVQDKIDDKAFLTSDYNKSLFVCNFDDSSGGWMVADPVLCYDEADSPFAVAPAV